MKKSFILLTFLFIFTTLLYAIPAIPYPITFSQPNGDTLTIMVKGDERIHWHETMDGFTLLFNKAGYLSYAQLDEIGNLQPSDIIASNIEERDIIVSSFLNTIEKHLFYSDIQRQLMLQVWEIEDEFEARGERGVTGEYRTLCAFVQFPNKSFIKTMSQFEGLFNQLGYIGNGTGSVRDFFKECSYNQFDLIITLCGIYTAPQNEAYYAGSDGTQRCRELARWTALQVAAEPHINFVDYDSNNDGKVDGFHFIFAGMGQEAGGGSGTIWSHKWQFSPAVTKNGKSISVYSCSPELLSGTTITTIGVVCHEMTHAFGAPDFYDTNGNTGGSYTGTGNWDLMASGSWNGSPSGNRPAHHNMYTKVQFGWVTPIVLNSPTTINNMPSSAANPIAYRINTTTNNEHYLLENRQRTKFDSNVPGSGLLIYHVHSNVGTNCINCTHPQKMYPVCASRTTQMPSSGSSNYGNINSAGTPFPGTSNKTSFTDNSTPAMWSWANVHTNKPITNITHQDQLISFDFMGGGSGTTYTITAISGENGDITPSGDTQVFEDGSQTYSMTPNIHYVREKVLIDGTNNTAAVNMGSYTFTNVNSNHTIEASFSPKTYTITFNANGGKGVMNPQDITYGTSQDLTPNTYTNLDAKFKNWNTNINGYGISYTDEQNVSPISNILLYAQWETTLTEFTIFATATPGGEISPSGKTTVPEGASQLFSILPNITLEGSNKIIDVLVDGISKGAIEEYLFKDVKEDHTIHAIFEDVGIDETTLNNSFLQIIPNPANDYIELRVASYELQFESIEFYNVFGQLVKNIPYHAEIQNNTITQRISVSDLNKGLYFIKVGSETAKLIIQ